MSRGGLVLIAGEAAGAGGLCVSFHCETIPSEKSTKLSPSAAAAAETATARQSAKRTRELMERIVIGAKREGEREQGWEKGREGRRVVS